MLTRLPDSVAWLRVVGIHIGILAPAGVAVQAHVGVPVQNLKGDEDVWVGAASWHGDAIQVGEELRADLHPHALFLGTGWWCNMHSGVRVPEGSNSPG